jgi:hypothetical protein
MFSADDACIVQNGDPPLHESVKRGDEARVQYLITAGADANDKDCVCDQIINQLPTFDLYHLRYYRSNENKSHFVSFSPSNGLFAFE